MVEDDQSVRDSLGLLLGLQGYPVVMFADAESFLRSYQKTWSGCVLMDIRMPGMDGLALQKKLIELGCYMPVIIMTGHGDVESAREAFRAHAIDFLEKPIDDLRLMRALEEAFAQNASQEEKSSRQEGLDRLLASLTPREREVIEMVVKGRHNREIAESLDISPRTIEVHKARAMMKLQVETVPDLVRLYLG